MADDKHILSFDSETSGLNAKKHCILQAYFSIHDRKTLKQIDELELFLKPNHGEISFEAEALKVTGIDLEKHLADPRTITMAEGKVLLVKFLEKNKIKGKRRSFTPMAYNNFFDKTFIFEQLISQDEWSKLVHHKNLDPFEALAWLQEAGLFPEELGSLGSLVEYFGISKRNAHNAKDDVLMTVDIYAKILNIIKGLKPGNDSSVNILDILEFKE